MIEGQRVNIQYSVLVEELPKTLVELLDAAETDLRDVVAEYASCTHTSDMMVHESYLLCAERVDKLRLSLADIDYRLSDCASMLKGLAQMKTAPPEKIDNRMDEIQEAIAQTQDLAERTVIKTEEQE